MFGWMTPTNNGEGTEDVQFVRKEWAWVLRSSVLPSYFDHILPLGRVGCKFLQNPQERGK